MTDIIAIIGTLATLIGTLVAIAAAVIASIQARAAERSLHQAQLLKLFGSFDVASESTIANPELLYSVHGLSKDVPIEEARNIAYLSMLLDSFQHFYSEKYDGDFTKMVKEMKSQSTFLNRILTVEENKLRWQILKKIYYGDFDSGFVAAIETLMADKAHMK